MISSQLVDLWPLFGLTLRTPRLVLTPVADSHLPALVAAAQSGVHDPAEMPFDTPWANVPAANLGPDMSRHIWRSRAATAPEHWDVQFAVLLDGTPIGVQDVRADDFAVLRQISTGSWLQRAHQGRGLGAEMRAALLMLAFDHLGATKAESAAFADNHQSLRVSEKLGYAANGTRRVQRRPGEPVESRELVVTPATFIRPSWSVAVTGLTECRPLLGF